MTTNPEHEGQLLSVLNDIVNQTMDEAVMVTGAIVHATILDSEGVKREVTIATNLPLYEQLGLTQMFLLELQHRYAEWTRGHNHEGNEDGSA